MIDYDIFIVPAVPAEPADEGVELDDQPAGINRPLESVRFISENRHKYVLVMKFC